MFRKDFQVLSGIRIREARVLLRARLFDGAYYLGGLAVENALKACVARATQRYEFPDRSRTNRVYSHNLEGLLKEAGLEPRLRAAHPTLQAAWAKTKAWQVEVRYESGKSEVEASEYLRAAAGRDGVLQWMKQFW